MATDTTPHSTNLHTARLKLLPRDAATLSELARDNADTLNGLCEFILNRVAVQIRHYSSRWQALVACDCDVPEDLQQAIRDLEKLALDGCEIGRLTACHEALKVDAVYERIDQVSRLQQARKAEALRALEAEDAA